MKETQKNYIELLLRLYFLQEKLNNKFNQYTFENNKIEKYYLINERIINQIKSFYLYPNLLNALNNKNIEILIHNYKNDIENNNFNEEINNLIRILPIEYINYIKGKNINDLKEINNIKLYKIIKNFYKNN